MTAIIEVLSGITVGEAVLSAALAAMAHEAAVRLLPDRIAGPGGQLIDTAPHLARDGRHGPKGR